jgi:hypothetical protein
MRSRQGTIEPHGLRDSVAFPGQGENSTGMIKNLLSNKTVAAASGECFVIGVKLADTEAHAIRLFAFVLLATSTAVLIHEWHHKAAAESTSTRTSPVKHVQKRSKHSRRQ